tara:strand:+ start:2157 stop:3221 length:1065 start_codon:yes stop_codon:yes gene_type:complete
MKRTPPRLGSSKKVESKQNTLVVDGNALFKRGYSATKRDDEGSDNPIGGIYQFLTVLRKLMEDDLYHKVYVFWDGPFSGKLRWEIYKDYKGNRNKDYINGTIPDDEMEVYQRGIVFNYLEELYIRQLIDEKVEADDFIAYYCKAKQDVENITVVTSDMDICQLVSKNVRLYMINLKRYITTENFKSQYNYHYENIALIKILCGDNSDNIKGVKRLGEDTLFKHFPQLTERKVTLDEIIDGASKLQNERLEGKKNKLQVLENIIEGITEGCQGNNLYEVNKKLIDLTTPLVSAEALKDVNLLIESPLSDDRSIKNAYRMLKNDGLDKVLGQSRYETYLLPFKKLMEREKKENIIN